MRVRGLPPQRVIPSHPLHRVPLRTQHTPGASVKSCDYRRPPSFHYLQDCPCKTFPLILLLHSYSIEGWVPYSFLLYIVPFWETEGSSMPRRCRWSGDNTPYMTESPTASWNAELAPSCTDSHISSKTVYHGVRMAWFRVSC